MTDLMKNFLNAEDENDHTGAALIIARALPGAVAAAFVTILEEIEARQELNGCMLPNDRDLRDSIQRDVLNTARIMEMI